LVSDMAVPCQRFPLLVTRTSVDLSVQLSACGPSRSVHMIKKRLKHLLTTSWVFFVVSGVNVQLSKPQCRMETAMNLYNLIFDGKLMLFFHILLRFVIAARCSKVYLTAHLLLRTLIRHI